VTYVIEKFALAGGVLSIVQLVNRLTLLGWDAKIVTHHEHNQEHLDAYMLYHQPAVYPTVDAMVEHFPESDVVVASLWSTAAKVQRVIERMPDAVPWYFVQDDETNFFHGLDRQGRKAVLDSYDMVPNKIVKSEWLRDTLRGYGHDATIVPVGLDLDVFYSYVPHEERPMRILAMARPATPRRGFETLVRVSREVKRLRPEVEICFFGCPNLSDYGLDFEVTDLGQIPNDRLRQVYNSAAIVLDPSDYQGLGRIGLEGMACGAATVLTKFGGINEYVRDGENCFAVDPADESAFVGAIVRLVDDEALRQRFVEAGYETALRFSCDAEARTTSSLFAASIGLSEESLIASASLESEEARE
jgi:glycosyltransferase involved in cell wall biosynthesis